jgi:hypothetical protein
MEIHVRCRRLVPLAIVLCALAAPAIANADDRYVGSLDNTSGSCSQAASCTWFWAIVGAGNGDHIIVLDDGVHTVGANTYTTAGNLTIEGEPGTRPTINSTIPNIQTLNVNDTGVTVRNLDITTATTAGVIAVQLGPGTVMDGVRIFGSSDASLLRMTNTSVLRNSVVYSSLSNRMVFGAGKVLGSTIITDGPAGYAALALDNNFNAGDSLYVRNSIIRGNNGLDVYLNNGGGGGSAGTLDIDYSNYVESLQNGNPGSTFTEGSHNQRASDPLLANISSAIDIHQTFGSPTRDAGVADADMGATDIDGQPRVMGAAPDIGADEYYVAPPPPVGGDKTAPVISKLKAKKKKGKLKTFDFTSTEAGTATFTFTKKKGKKYKSAGSQTKTVKAGKNSIKPKKLKKGSYKLTLTVKDASGNISTAKRISFKIK